MRVECNSVEDFVANLTDDVNVFQGVIRVNRQRTAVSEEKMKFGVTLQASAVVVLETEEGEFLLECGEDCGVDYLDGEEETYGTSRADDLMNQLNVLCQRRQWRILPGVIGL